MLNPIQTKLGELIFLEAWSDVQEDKPFLNGVMPALDCIIEFVGEDFAGLQCVENLWVDGVITQSSHDSVPDFIVAALSHECALTHKNFSFSHDEGYGQSVDLTFWSDDYLGKIATINISDSGSSGVDGGLLICSRRKNVKDFLTPTNVADQEHTSR